MRQRKVMRAQGNAKITIADYRTGVDCNQRGYNARIVAASTNATVQLDNTIADTSGC
jgi:hypothetical protein